MKDLVVVLMTLAFFAIAIGYVRLCDRIIGPDEVIGDAPEAADGGDADLGGDAGDRPVLEATP